MNSQVVHLLIMHEKLERMHRTVYALMQSVETSVKTDPMTQHDRVDSIYVMRLMEALLDDTRKETKKVKELIEKITCLTWVKDATAEPTVRGTLCRGKPDVRQAARIPSQTKEPERFAELMAALKIPIEMVERGVVKPHWPNMVTYLTNLSVEGLPFPAGIRPDDSYDVYSVSCTKHRNIELSEVRKELDGVE